MKNIWRPFTQMQTAPQELPLVSKAKKAHLILETGQTVIDAISSWWVITHGHCDPFIVKEVQKQSEKLDQVLFANFTHAAAQNLIKELSPLLPKKLQNIFFSDDGSTSVEVALKMAIQSRAQQGHPERKNFLSFSHSYHGDTVGAMSVSGSSPFTSPYKSVLFQTFTAKQGRYRTDSPSTFYKDFERKLEKHHKTLAGVIIEPFIQGAGGMIVWPQEALEHICKLSREAGVYLIFDEVMTGFGRTGTLFAFQQLKTLPDILCLSKGLTGGFLPLGLSIAQDEIYTSFSSSKKETCLFHGHSFTGNPISCAAAFGNLKKIRRQGPSLEKKWNSIEALHKERALNLENKVKDVRWKGLVAAVEKKKNQGRKTASAEEITQKALKRGVFLRPLGDVLYILPPYSITKQELHKVWDVIEDLL